MINIAFLPPTKTDVADMSLVDAALCRSFAATEIFVPKIMLHISTAFSSKAFSAFRIGVRGGQIIPSGRCEAPLEEERPPSAQPKTTAMGC